MVVIYYCKNERGLSFCKLGPFRRALEQMDGVVQYLAASNGGPQAAPASPALLRTHHAAAGKLACNHTVACRIMMRCQALMGMQFA